MSNPRGSLGSSRHGSERGIEEGGGNIDYFAGDHNCP
jgi:hypothetical protein